jgi:aspartyl-tRNA(Asn)/glutamyl-tRNA(Gln) amidotransferase subunit A
MTMPEPITRDLPELASDMRNGLSPIDLVESLLARIDERNNADHAFITVMKDPAIEAARRTAANIRASGAGVLQGIPYACKDLFFSKGIRTTAGSRVLEDWKPDADAAVVERLSAAGAIMIGKANMHEFAHGITGENPHFGTPPNPWDRTRLAGGSSSGSAVAVANGLACFALGTDTGGSIRVPAALCGLVGLKPTYGRVSFHGAIPYCWSLDHVGIITARVADAVEVLQAIAGHDPRDPASLSVPVPDYKAVLQANAQGMRIGVPRGDFFEHADPEILRAVGHGIELLKDAGASIVEIDLPSMDKARAVSLLIQMPEALSYHRRYLPEKIALYGADVRGGLAFGQFILAEQYVKAKRMIEVYRRDLSAVFRKVDAIVTPTCPIVSPKIGAVTVSVDGIEEPVGNALTRFTGFFNMTGHPAVSIPCGLHSLRLPIGMQIVGRPFDEATVLSLAQLLERRYGWLFS